MINSSIIKQELLRGNRNYQVTATIVVKDGDGNSVTLNLDNTKIMLGGLEIDDAVSEDEELTAIGSTIINSTQLVINNSTEEFSEYDFDKATCVIYVGLNYINGTTQDTENIKKFTGFVDTAIYNGIYITLTVYDNMAKLNVPYTSSVSFPTIDTAVLIQLCNACGVAIKTSSLPLPGTSYNLEEKPSGESATCLDVVGWIAAIHGCFARCDVNGELEFKWFDQNLLPGIASGTDGGSFDSGTPYSTGDDVDGGTFNPWNTGDVLDGGSFEDLDALHVISGLSSQNISTDDVVITGVRVVVENTDASSTATTTEYTVGTAGYVIEVSGNPFITSANMQTIATAIGNKIIGLTYRKANITHLSDPTIEAGDVALIRDRKGRVYPILVTRTHFSVSSYQETVSGAKTPVRNSAVQYSKTAKNIVELQRSLKTNVNDLNQRLLTASGLYETEVPQTGGGTIRYLHNKSTRAASDIQIAFSDLGILLTANGTDSNPTWYGLQANGTMLASILNANGINADWIRTGAFEATSGGNTIFKLDATNKTMEWDLPYSSMDIDGILKLIDSGETGNASVSVEWEANHSLSKMFSTGFICEFDSTTPKFYSTITARGVNAESLWYDDPSDESTYWQYYYDFSVADKLLSVGKIRYENNSVISNDNLFRIDLANDTVRIKGNDVATVSTPTFTANSGYTISQQTWSQVGNIVTGDLTFTSSAAISTTTVQVGTLSVAPGHTVIVNARTATVQMRGSINSSGVLQINSPSSINANTTIYVSLSFVTT